MKSAVDKADGMATFLDENLYEVSGGNAGEAAWERGPCGKCGLA